MSKVDFHISIEKDLLKEFRRRCVDDELGAGEVVAKLIRGYLGGKSDWYLPANLERRVDAPIVMEGVVVPGPMPKIEMMPPQREPIFIKPKPKRRDPLDQSTEFEE